MKKKQIFLNFFLRNNRHHNLSRKTLPCLRPVSMAVPFLMTLYTRTSPSAILGGCALFMFLHSAAGANILQDDASSPFIETEVHAESEEHPTKEEDPYPLLLTADHLNYHKEHDLLEATGHVEITQFLEKPVIEETKDTSSPIPFEKSVLLEKAPDTPKKNVTKKKEPKKLQRTLVADRVTYHRTSKQITASGNVLLIDEDGNILWSDHIDMDDAFDNGFVQSARILLAHDDGRLTAATAHRKNGRLSIFKKATYSPCHVCKSSPTPLWQLRATKVTHDQERRLMIYHGATMDILGIPILYTPYLYHPDPKVKRESGILMPTFGQSTDFGTILKTPYYYVIDKHSDMTITPTITTKQGMILASEYRKRFKRGELHLDGSITQTHHLDRANLRRQNAASVPPKTRYHLLSKGRFELSDKDLITLELNRASDTTYLRRYNVVTNNQKLANNKSLTSFGRYEHFEDKSYLGLTSYAFQSDTQDTVPYVFPLARYLYQSDPGSIGQVFGLDGHFLTLTRRQSVRDVTPKGSTRAIANGTFYIPYVTPNGHVLELDGRIRGGMYAIHGYNTSFQTPYSDYTTGRILPTVSGTWRYPLISVDTIKRIGGIFMMEPTVQIVTSPNGLNPRKIPNEDCRFSELNDLNLFFMDRMTGFDRADSGQRVVYGMNAGLYGARQRRITGFLGQSQRLNRYGNELFGERRRASDYVTRFQYVPIHWLRLHYRGRFDAHRLENRFSEVSSNIGTSRFMVNTSYVYVDKRETQLGQQINQLNWQIQSKLSEKWSVGFTRTQNLSRLEKNAKAYMASAAYQNECFQLSFGAYRTQYRDRDLRPDSGIMIQFSFKNLGTFTPMSSGTFPTPGFRRLDYP